MPGDDHGGFAFETVWPDLDKGITAAVYCSLIVGIILIAIVVYMPIDIFNKIVDKITCGKGSNCCKKKDKTGEGYPLEDHKKPSMSVNAAEYAAF